MIYWVHGQGWVFEGWAAIGFIVVVMLVAGLYVSWVLIGFNRDEAKKGFPPAGF